MKGFTFIELLLAIVILAILATTGSAIFLHSLRGTSATELRRTLDDRARLILDSMGRFLREGQITGLAGQTRANCLAGGSVNGDVLSVKALDGLTTNFSVSAGMLSSISGQTVVINPEGVTIAYKAGIGYFFTWYCSGGVPDRIMMQFTATSTGLGGDTSINSDYVLDTVSRNSSQ